MKKNQKGFSLIEITFVILIIGILLVIALPNFWYARRKSLIDKDTQNLVNSIQLAKQNSISVLDVVRPMPTESSFLGYALHFGVSTPDYYIYEWWNNAQNTPVFTPEADPARSRKYQLEDANLNLIQIGGNNYQVIDIRFNKLKGDIFASSAGSEIAIDSITLTLKSKLIEDLERKILLSKGGSVEIK